MFNQTSTLMKNLFYLIFFGGAAFLLSACDYDKYPEEVPVKQNVSFDADIQPILNQECTSCHNPSEVDPDLREGFAYESLMNLPEESIVPGNAEASELMEMLEWEEGSDNPMPPAGPMTPEKIALIRQWINEGAKDN